MKIKELNELKIKSAAELENLALEKKTKLHNLNVDLAAGKVKNVTEVRHLKKDIARVLTFLNQSHKNKK